MFMLCTCELKWNVKCSVERIYISLIAFTYHCIYVKRRKRNGEIYVCFSFASVHPYTGVVDVDVVIALQCSLVALYSCCCLDINYSRDLSVYPLYWMMDGSQAQYLTSTNIAHVSILVAPFIVWTRAHFLILVNRERVMLCGLEWQLPNARNPDTPDTRKRHRF